MQNLAGKEYSGEQVRDRIVQASDLAQVDPYRATTHNKGIMNGVDALALATGNDWRAMEAAAHAYAARDGRYRALSHWARDADGGLVGKIEIPIEVGTVGGAVKNNPAARISNRLLGSPTGRRAGGLDRCRRTGPEPRRATSTRHVRHPAGTHDVTRAKRRNLGGSTRRPI